MGIEFCFRGGLGYKLFCNPSKKLPLSLFLQLWQEPENVLASHPEGLQGFGLEEKVPAEEVRVGQLSKACTTSLRDPILSLHPEVSALPGPHCKASFKRLSKASTYVLGACQVIVGSKLCKCFSSPLLSCLVGSVWRWLGWICKAPLLFVGGRLCRVL